MNEETTPQEKPAPGGSTDTSPRVKNKSGDETQRPFGQSLGNLSSEGLPKLIDFFKRARLLNAILLTLGIVAAVVAAFGANPATVAWAIIQNSLTRQLALGNTIMLTSILALTGLSAAIPFTARLWNIGGHGQMFAGAIASAVLGLTLPESIPAGLFVLILIVGGALGGAVWGLIPGMLKAYLNVSEIVTSLMLNFVAFWATAYVVNDRLPDVYSQNQTRQIHDNARYPLIWEKADVDIGVFIALGATLLGWLLLTRTSLGFSIRAVGANPHASNLAGVKTKKVTISSFAAAGLAAGLAGSIMLQTVLDYKLSLEANTYGYIGIAVALLARLNPIAILPAAFLFSTLEQGSGGLKAAAGISPSLGDVLIATFLILLLVTGVIQSRSSQVEASQ